MQQASRYFNDVSNSATIWKTFACKFACQTVTLVGEDEFYGSSELPLAELRRAVLRTSYLQENWDKDAPTMIGPPASAPLGFSVMDTQLCGQFFVTNRHILLTGWDGRLVCWDTKEHTSIDTDGQEMGQILYSINGAMTLPIFSCFTIKIIGDT